MNCNLFVCVLYKLKHYSRHKHIYIIMTTDKVIGLIICNCNHHAFTKACANKSQPKLKSWSSDRVQQSWNVKEKKIEKSTV